MINKFNRAEAPTEKQPEALCLADALKRDHDANWPDFGNAEAAIEELRRLHAENESLRAGYSAARLEIASLKERVQQLGQLARDVNSRRVVELEAQLEAVGAGGVEPLRKRCLHQISEPAQAQPVASESLVKWASLIELAQTDWHTGYEAARAYVKVQLECAAPQPAAQALDSVRVFWQQHTQADALSMTMAELHADVELVIRAARGAAQAAPVGMEPVAWIDMEAWPPIRWREGMVRADVREIDGMALCTASQVQAMLAKGLAPGWQAVPVKCPDEICCAIEREIDSQLAASGIGAPC